MKLLSFFLLPAALFLTLSASGPLTGPPETDQAGDSPPSQAESELISTHVDASAAEEFCVRCHEKHTPGIVADWRTSQHAENEISCSDCHGDDHRSRNDVDEVSLPTPDTCDMCHDDRVAEYRAGKHAVAWAAMKAMPSFHNQPGVLTDGLKGCGGCHKIGEKTEEEYVQLKLEGHGHGVASCDACHTRHTFSAEEARQPEACRTCHMGFDHPQWEMYTSSKHGVRNDLKRLGIVSEESSAPTCQTCHMPDGNHQVGTAWGFLAVKTPLPDDPEWAADQETIMKALGLLDPSGNPTPRFDVAVAARLIRTEASEWFDERARMIAVCDACHATHFVETELEKGDQQIRTLDRVMAEAIDEVAALYAEGILKKPEAYAYAYPDLLTFHDAASPVEQQLFVMFMKHRMRGFQAMFHMNPDYALWYGWSEMVRDLTEIRHDADEMRFRARMEEH